MLFDVINFYNFKINWKQAIKFVINDAINLNKCSPEYAEDIIEATHKYGPYYVLAPNLALIHAQTNQHVKVTGLSLCFFKFPVAFNDSQKHQAQIVVALYAANQTDHLVLIQKFAEIFTPNFIQDLSKVESLDHLKNCLSSLKIGK